MTRIGRRPVLRWTLRILLLLTASELALALAARVVERTGSSRTAGGGVGGAVVCIGDSNTFGVGASTGKSYPDQLRARLQAAGDGREVVNLGFPGFTAGQAVDRLARSLADGVPACVLFLGGVNDGHGDQLFALPTPAERSLGEQLVSRLAALRTWRVAVAAVRAVTGDVARAEYGGSKEGVPGPSDVNFKHWDTIYPQAEAAGFEAIFTWLSGFWRCELADRAARAWSALQRTPEFPQIEERLRYPLDVYEWELAMMAGRAPPPLPLAPRRDKDDVAFARYTHARSALEGGDYAAARRDFEALRGKFPGVIGNLLIQLHLAWIPLLERDFAAADAALEAALVVNEGISPKIGRYFSLGGSALAWLLKDEATTLADWQARHQKSFTEAYWWSHCPQGQEWVAAAELVGALKAGDAKAVAEHRGRSHKRFGPAVRTAPLRWLLEHPDATFAQVRAGLPLEPPRIAWIGPSRFLLKAAAGEELPVLTKPAFDRLEGLAKEHGFPVVLLTYLNYELVASNDLLRKVARERKWPLVDLHLLHPRAELAADNKKKYFSLDLGHPNDAGYALVAKAVEDALQALKRQ